jgi:hypothetical protein
MNGKALCPLQATREEEVRHQQIADLLQLLGVQSCPRTVQPWDLDDVGIDRSANGRMALRAAEIHELLWITRFSPIVPLIHNPWQRHIRATFR